MKKRVISILLMAAIILTASLTLSGCSKKDANFPVTIGQTEIPEKPEKIAVLSDNLADIIIYMDEFESQICAISDSCTQPELTKYLESVGSETNPSVDALVRSGAQYVLTDTPLSDTIKTKLTNKGITVLNFMVPKSAEQLATLYSTLGTLFGGKTDGKTSGESSFNRLFDVLSSAGKKTSDAATMSLCYLYLDKDGNLCAANGANGCFGMVLDYACITNINSGIFGYGDDPTYCIVDKNALKVSKPTYILYSGPEVLSVLQNKGLSDLPALSNGNSMMIPKENLERYGKTMVDTQKLVLNLIYGDITIESYAEQYGIDITKGIPYQNGDSADDVRIIQQRLVDLEYLDLEGDEPTTTFGNKTEAAVKEFQIANGLESNGIVSKETLEKLFLSTTLSKSGKPVAPPTQNATTQPDNTNTDATKTYDIDLTLRKDYEVNYDEGFEDVKVIQERLHDLGYFTPEDGEYTNIFGNQTAEAFKLFESANGLEADGIASYEDLLVLFPDNDPNN